MGIVAMKKAILPAEIEIVLRPSRWVWGWLIVFSILCLGCICMCLPAWLAVCMTVVYLALLLEAILRLPHGQTWRLSGAYHSGWLARCLRNRNALCVASIRVDVYGQMWFTMYDGQCWQVDVMGDSVVSVWGMVLCVRLIQLAPLLAEEDTPIPLPKTMRVLILPDMLPASQWRSLSVWLRWGTPLSQRDA